MPWDRSVSIESRRSSCSWVHRPSSASVLNCVKVMVMPVFGKMDGMVNIVEMNSLGFDIHGSSPWDAHIYVMLDRSPVCFSQHVVSPISEYQDHSKGHSIGCIPYNAPPHLLPYPYLAAWCFLAFHFWRYNPSIFGVTYHEYMSLCHQEME